MINVSNINAFHDNYIWLLQDDNKHCVLVDPGESEAVLTKLNNEDLILDAILLTHHHNDHIGGVEEIKKAFPQVAIYGPDTKRFTQVTHPVSDNSHFELLGVNFNTLKVTGHTIDHVAFHTDGMLFCGDTLFSAGCGRLFEGTPTNMYNSLQLLSTLPDKTEIYCAHEYTLNNLKFASTVEPKNTIIEETIVWAKQQRLNNLPTLPSTIGHEKAINPFLRCHLQSVKNAVQDRAIDDSPIAIFTALRIWKDNF